MNLIHTCLLQAYEIFKDAFMNDARVSHMVQVMGFHPSYTVEWVRAHHYLLRGNGVLPRHIRAYVAILVSCYPLSSRYLGVI